MKRNVKSYIQKRKKCIYDVICSKNYRPMRLKEIAMLLDIPKEKRYALSEVLNILENEGKIFKNADGKYSKVVGNRNRLNSGESEGIKRRFAEKGVSGKEKSEWKKTGKQISEKDPLGNIIAAFGVISEFPERVMRQASKLPAQVSAEDMVGRKDFRELQMITIDGEDSKDLDDAVSIRKTESGWELGVHIADVSHYVTAGSPLDKEALKRGTSVYICDRVIPMLPKSLSNGICSLNEGVNRLALSCMMQVDADGHIKGSRIYESVICVDRRMTYTAVDRIFQGEMETAEEYRDQVPMLTEMRQVALKMRAIRERRGAIQFEFPETKIETDASGKPVRIYAAYATEATKLIEEFMLAANESVAETYKEVPFLFRVHEDPDAEKIEEALSLVREQGIDIRKFKRDISPSEINRILEKAKASPKFNMISTTLLRSMKQARYSHELMPHFGLASKCYCHFTSPIRRYPDLQIHRIIKDQLCGRLHESKLRRYDQMLENVAWKSSALERRAVEVERETNKYKIAEYMMDHIGEEYDGIISGVTDWGFYVQLENMAEGLVPMRALEGDYYTCEGQQLIGRRHGRIYELGQPVRVRVEYAELERRIVDFSPVED